MMKILKILIVSFLINIQLVSIGYSESYFDFIVPNLKYSSINNSRIHQLNFSCNLTDHSESNDGYHADFDDSIIPKPTNDSNQYENGYINYFKLGINIRMNGENRLKFLPNLYLVDCNVTTNINYTKQLFFWQIKLINYDSELPFKEDFSLINLKIGYGYTFLNRLHKYLYANCVVGIGYTSFEPDNSLFEFKNTEKFKKIISSDPSFYFQLIGLYNFISFDLKYDRRWLFGSPIVSLSDISGRIGFNKRRILDLSGVDSFHRIAINDYSIFLEYQFLKIEQKELLKNFIKISCGVNYNIPF